LTVRINYGAHVGGCEYNLCFPIVPENYYKNSDDSKFDSDGFLITDTNAKKFKPLGNGFYKIESYEYAQRLELVSAESSFGTPYIDRVSVIIVDDKETELSAYRSGLIDAVSADINEWGGLGSDEKTTATPYSTSVFEFIAFNNKKEPFSQLTYRQAFAYAVPVQSIIDSIYVGNVTKSLTPYSPVSMFTSSVGMESYDYSVRNSQAMLSSGGYSGDDLNVEILVNEENTGRTETANRLAKSLQTVGFKASVTAVSFDEYSQRIENDDFDVFIGSINVSTDMDLTGFLSSESVYGGRNYSNFSDGRMDSLLKNVTTAKNTEEYKLALSEASKYCSNQLPVVGIGFKDNVLLTKDKVKGIKKPLDGYVFENVNEWYVDGE
jgi:peptide/nickel transport system substrate-binding protein